MSDGHSVVFLGPTLPAGEARRLFDAEVLPPVELGDVWRVSQEQPAAIGIVDGYFHQVPAVWHKEILYALSRGIAVYGAASMGALRAAELHPFGMVGVGVIAAAYTSGELQADDEVALLHAPAELGYQGLSEPLVNVRATLDHARRGGVVSTLSAEALLMVARSLPYPQRAWPRLLDSLRSDEARALAAWLPTGRIDQKREDAVAMLQRMRADAALGAERPRQAPPTFEPTVLWQELVQRETPLQDIVDEFLLLDSLPAALGVALPLLQRARGAQACAALSAAPEWAACCRRARRKRAAWAQRAESAAAADTDTDQLLSWFFAERLGWPGDLDAFLLARGWTEPKRVLRAAAREAAFLGVGSHHASSG